MTKTNLDAINEVLDEIIKEAKKENVKILATRMRNDVDFCLDTLSFITILLYKRPSLVEKVNEVIAFYEARDIIQRLFGKD